MQIAGRKAPFRQDATCNLRPRSLYRRACIRFFAFLVSALSRFLIFTNSLGAQTPAPSPTSTQPIALKAARLFDGKSKTLVPNGVVVIEGNTITAAGSNVPIPDNAQIIDLGDATLSPGFMDAHTHLTFDFSGNYNERRLRMLDENISQLALEMIPNAKATIEAGFTSVRDVGSGFPNSHDFPDVSLRNAINQGVIPGPRMLVATHGIGATGGHFDSTNGFRDMLFGAEPDWTDGIADGPDAIRKAVRFEVKNGADVIKAAVSGGVLSLADEVDVPQFDPAEMAALVDETHRLRKKVAVHCHGDAAAKEAINAGVDSIEHGSFMKPDTLQLMKQKGTYLTPTLMASEWVMQKISQYPPAIQAKGRAATEARSEMFRNAVQDRSEDFLRDRCGRLSARNECEGICAHGRTWDETDRRFAQRHLGRCGAFWCRKQTRHPGKRKTRRRDCHARRPDRRYHRDRARLFCHERRQDREE